MAILVASQLGLQLHPNASWPYLTKSSEDIKRVCSALEETINLTTNEMKYDNFAEVEGRVMGWKATKPENF